MKHSLGSSSGNILLSSLGSFWNIIFKQKELLRVILNAQQIKIEDLYFRLCEIALGNSIENVSIFSKKHWYNLTLKESNIGVGTGALNQYGDDIIYGKDGLLYGGRRDQSEISLRLPDDIDGLGNFLCNRIYNPSHVLSKGRDFFIRNNVIVFKENIFNNDYIAYNTIYDDEGLQVDKEISLWVPVVYTDLKDMYHNFGVLFDIDRDSSPEYKIFLNVIISLFVNGPKRRYVEGFLNATFGLPIALDKETIKYIDTTDDYKTIYTKNNTYKLDRLMSITPLVVGQELEVFDTFHDVVEVIENKDSPTWIKNRKFFTIPDSLLSGEYLTPLTVLYKTVNVPLKVDSTFSLDEVLMGETTVELEKVSLSVGMNGLAIGESNVKINTYDYITDQVKSNIFFIVLKSVYVNTAGMSKKFSNILKEALPAFCTYIMMSELEFDDVDLYNTLDQTAESISLGEGRSTRDTVYSTSEIRDGRFGVIQLGDPLIVDGGAILGSEEFIPGSLLIVIKEI